MKIQSNKTYLIIPAAGLGTRFSSDSPKQYTKLGSLTILEKTIECFVHHDDFSEIIIAINKDDKYFNDLEIAKHEKVTRVIGGETRAESVLAALKTIKDNSVVMVHDAVRPFIKSSEIKTMISSFGAMDEDILIFGIPVYESLKQIDKDSLFVKKSVDRNKYYLAQTPQITMSQSLETAIELSLKENFVPGDESEAIERAGGKVRFIQGSRKNIKITVEEDLNTILDNERLGNGFDSHRFKDGDGLMIGGLKIPYSKSFLAHSDGDIVLHAIIDSMLGALSLGDIGQHFPNTDEWENCSGSKMFSIAYKKIREKGYKLKQLDIIVILEEPKLLDYKDQIIGSISQITDLDKDLIGFKAKTSEKMGFIGENEGAACMVLCRLQK